MKNAFTLVEAVVSIAIFSIIALYMHQAVNTAKNSNDIYVKRFEGEQKEHKIIKLFYNDFFSRTDVYALSNITSGAEFDILYMRTKNSIHAMINPYVAYFVNKDSLYRIESKNFESIPLAYDSAENVKIDKLLENVTIFRIYENKNSYLINYKSEDKFTSFQISLPQKPPSSNTSNHSRN